MVRCLNTTKKTRHNGCQLVVLVWNMIICITTWMCLSSTDLHHQQCFPLTLQASRLWLHSFARVSRCSYLPFHDSPTDWPTDRLTDQPTPNPVPLVYRFGSSTYMCYWFVYIIYSFFITFTTKSSKSWWEKSISFSRNLNQLLHHRVLAN